jgi:hypothetical protein
MVSRFAGTVHVVPVPSWRTSTTMLETAPFIHASPATVVFSGREMPGMGA